MLAEDILSWKEDKYERMDAYGTGEEIISVMAVLQRALKYPTNKWVLYPDEDEKGYWILTLKYMDDGTKEGHEIYLKIEDFKNYTFEIGEEKYMA